MEQYRTQDLRAVAVVGHGAAGKTTLVESLLAASGAISSAGSVEKGNTVSDFDAQEKELGHSLATSALHFDFQGVKIQLLDTPGFPDFVAQPMGALAAVETALVVINAQTGIEYTTERMMQYAEERDLCRMIVVNKIDVENIDLAALVADIRERFGKRCLILDLPAHHLKDAVDVLHSSDAVSDFDSVAEAHRALIDQIVEEDEDLLANYLDTGLDPDENALHAPFEKAMRAGHLIPILFVSAKTGAGVPQLMDVLARLAPSPLEGNPPKFIRKATDGAFVTFDAKPDSQRHLLGYVFKVISDPYLGKLSVFRVFQGQVKKDAQLFAGDAKKPIKLGRLYRLQGKETQEVECLVPGDLGAVAKIDEIDLGCVLHDSHDEDAIEMVQPPYPQPMLGLAVETQKKSDEQRLFDVLHKLELEDPCFTVERHPTTNETVIRGLGESHLRAKLARLATQFKLELITKPPRIDYRESVTKPADGHFRHKKQSGGAGQFGEVMLKVEPLPEGAGFEFVDVVKGGAIPGVFMAAVEKGVRQALDDGVIAGFPVSDIRVTIVDGKSHSVDSKDIAFFTAGRKATIAAIRAASPIVLEPVVDVVVQTPESALGDLAGDLSSRRGQVTGSQTASHGAARLTGKVPLAELTDYQGRLKSLTAGQGSYSMAFSHYAQVPFSTQQQLVAEHSPEALEE